MADRKVMSREEAFDSIARAGAAALAGKPLPDEIGDTVVMEAADAADGMHAFVREIAWLFDRISASVSDEVVIQKQYACASIKYASRSSSASRK